MRPNVWLKVGPSFIGRDHMSGEIVETVEATSSGLPKWEAAGICDGRGPDHSALVSALVSAEKLARATGIPLWTDARPRMPRCSDCQSRLVGRDGRAVCPRCCATASGARQWEHGQ